MKAWCLVGGCDWATEGDFVVQLQKEAEDHRAEFHDWVKVGRVHKIDLPPAVIPGPVPITGPRRQMRRHR